MKTETDKKTILRRYVEEACEAAGVDLEGIREGYQGRGSYGSCWGVVLRNQVLFIAELVATIAIEAQEEEKDVEVTLRPVMRMLEQAETDSMGLDMILYFPGWTLGDEKS
jgi:hypothetical protein